MCRNSERDRSPVAAATAGRLVSKSSLFRQLAGAATWDRSRSGVWAKRNKTFPISKSYQPIQTRLKLRLPKKTCRTHRTKPSIQTTMSEDSFQVGEGVVEI